MSEELVKVVNKIIAAYPEFVELDGLGKLADNDLAKLRDLAEL